MSEQDFEEWFGKHDCPGGYEGSSPSMEKACARKVWDRSKDNLLEYRYMVSDGDSKACDEVNGTYGMCEDCNKDDQMEKLDEKSVEYLQWKNSPHYQRYIETHKLDNADCH